IDHEVGHRRIDCEPCIHLLIEPVLLFVERELREEAILVDQIIRDTHGIEEIVLTNVFELSRPLEQEEELRLQSGCARILVEALEKRVLVRLLENEIAPEAARESAREARLADADGSFHHDQTMRRRND